MMDWNYISFNELVDQHFGAHDCVIYLLLSFYVWALFHATRKLYPTIDDLFSPLNSKKHKCLALVSSI